MVRKTYVTLFFFLLTLLQDTNQDITARPISQEDGDLRNRIEDLEASIEPSLERHTQGREGREGQDSSEYRIYSGF